MPNTDEYISYIANDILSELGDVKTRRMFGGHGLYLNGKIFGIEANGKIYFKVTDSNRADYKIAGCEPFHYSRKDKGAVSMSYWEVPEDVLENREKAVQWAQKAVQASLERPPRKRRAFSQNLAIF